MIWRSPVYIPISADKAVLWFVRGIDGRAFATKGCAEKAARNQFPNESESVQYARISFKTFLWEEG